MISVYNETTTTKNKSWPNIEYCWVNIQYTQIRERRQEIQVCYWQHTEKVKRSNLLNDVHPTLSQILLMPRFTKGGEHVKGPSY